MKLGGGTGSKVGTWSILRIGSKIECGAVIGDNAMIDECCYIAHDIVIPNGKHINQDEVAS